MLENRPGDAPPGYRAADPDRMDRSDLVYLLQKGVLLRLPDVPAGGRTSVTEFLIVVMKLDRESLKDEIRTMMRNHLVVDNPDETYLKAGDTLVVSGAMPGLVGAMLRSDSPIKILRSTISGDTGESSADYENQTKSSFSFITLKAFNTALRDHLDDILRYGIFIEEEFGKSIGT